MDIDVVIKVGILFVVLAVAFYSVRAMRMVRAKQRALDPSTVKDWIDTRKADILILDVRTPAEFAGQLGRIAQAVNLPLGDLPKTLKTNKADLLAHKTAPVVLVCKTARRSANALLQMEAAGLRNVYIMAGGMMRWVEMGLPVTRAE